MARRPCVMAWRQRTHSGCQVEGAGRVVSAVPVLCKHLTSQRRVLRRNALVGLSNLSRHSKLARLIAAQQDVAENLVALCNSPDKEERRHAETAMGRLGDLTPAAWQPHS